MDFHENLQKTLKSAGDDSPFRGCQVRQPYKAHAVGLSYHGSRIIHSRMANADIQTFRIADLGERGFINVLFVIVMAVGRDDKNDHLCFKNTIYHTMFLRDLAAPTAFRFTF